MKKFVSIISFLILSLAAVGQDMSVEKAMETMKESATKFLKGEYTKIDATGADQYVDATVTKVYSFSDYSYGYLLENFVKYIKSKKVGLGHSNVQAEIIREIDYAQNHQTEIAAYSALVEYTGKTKFGETVNMSSLFFFDWEGQPIAVRNASYERGEYSAALAKVMEKRVISQLRDLKDPMFNKEKWISDPVYSNFKDTPVEYRFCLILDRGETPDGKSGPFSMYLYVVQTGNIYSKAITYTTGRFTETDNGFEFGFKKSSTSSFLVKSEYKRTFEIGDFSEIDSDQLEFSTLMTITYAKGVKKSNSVPDVCEIIDENHMKLSTPYGEGSFNLTKIN